MSPIHLQPTAALAERVLLPGDPGRAMLLAQSLLSEPKMFNHHRGLWGYTGEAADGRPLTIQSTGMGGPSAAIVIAELSQLGARTLVRVGTCGALQDTIGLGDVVVVTEALAGDGTSRGLGGADRVAPDPELLARLLSASPGAAHGPVVSSDLFYDSPDGAEEAWRDEGALAVEMESATLFALASRRALRAASVLLVSDIVLPRPARIEPDALHAGERAMGELAFAAVRS
jgi:DeoD family purine-nucleoside phosphorylase